MVMVTNSHKTIPIPKFEGTIQGTWSINSCLDKNILNTTNPMEAESMAVK